MNITYLLYIEKDRFYNNTGVYPLAVEMSYETKSIIEKELPKYNKDIKELITIYDMRIFTNITLRRNEFKFKNDY